MLVTIRAFALLAVVGQVALAQAPADSLVRTIKERVRASNPLIAARSARVDVALARRAATGLRPPASISAEIEEVPSFLNVVGAGSMRVDLSRDFRTSGVRTAEQAIADKDVERARLEVEVAERGLDAAVDQLLAKAGGSAAIAARLASEDSLLRGAEEALRARFSVGDARYTDVLRLRTERLRVETEIFRGGADARISRRELLRLVNAADTAVVGRMVDQAITRTASAFLTGPLAPLSSVDSLIAQSATIRLARLAIEEAEAVRRRALAERRPPLTASLGLQKFTGESGGAAFGVTAGVSLPLAATNRRFNDARLALADRELSLARAEQTLATVRVTSAIAVAADRYEVARAQLAAFDAALLRGAREEREAALAAYRTGSMPLIELIDFERALAQAEVTRLRSQLDAADALLDLIAAALGLDEIGLPTTHKAPGDAR